ncbi:MAG: hypothetical protein K6C06_11235, partial [Lachnospiraceae bacterium]|nr:hypothetical protein [Lachnospiraceae bacterium]
CSLSEDWEKAVLRFIDILAGVLEREGRECPFDPGKHFALLTQEELAESLIKAEYERFLDRFYRQGLYVFLRLSVVCTPFNILGHIAGVHHVSMYIARQLAGKDVPLDLALMSGAALMHDIGKYGCRPEESKRVPYLHYYYTYQYCRANHLENIGDIAANHSVWDLELENLSTESLLLIYADFRVKSVKRQDGREEVRFWSIRDAYDVILGKLDNLDDTKRERYTKVYAKLKDFEDYFVCLGCASDLISSGGREKEYAFPALMKPEEMTEYFRDLAIASNLEIMSTTMREDRFIDLLETIRSEHDARHVRAYLTALGEYSAYLPQNQKNSILTFLFDMMSHREGDIRRQAAAIAGALMADYDIRFTKDVPEGSSHPRIGEKMEDVFASFLEKLLHPDPNTGERERRYVGFAMKSVMQSLMQRLKEDSRRTIQGIYIAHCVPAYDPLTNFFLMDGACVLDCAICSEAQKERMENFAIASLSGTSGEESRTASLRFILCWMEQGWRSGRYLPELFRQYFPTKEGLAYSIRYLLMRIRQFYDIAGDPDVTGYEMSNLYLENQRLDVPWINKYVNLEILRIRQKDEKDPEKLYQYASHLLHMLQFSDRIVNRVQAGDNLLDIIPGLSRRQWHEIVQELVSALEIGEYAVSKYIPPCLGRMYPLLNEEEREYILGQMRRLTGSLQVRSAVAALETVGVILGETNAPLSVQEISRAEGILCAGMADYREEVAHEAFYVLGQKLFGSGILTLEKKQVYFSDLARKILVLRNWKLPGIYLYFNGVSLNRIYRFCNEYQLAHGKSPIEEEDLPVAFFPGTFDPFSLGHKRIVEKIREMGFCVYLAVDTFSWSKKPQPFEIRRKIISIATADIKEVFLFPEEIPVNIANAEDMKRLKQVFRGRKVHVVVGSDVVEHASAYRKPRTEGCISEFPHIIFLRNPENRDRNIAETRKLCGERISGKILFMTLPPLLEEVSSTRIRDNINSGRDILGMIDENVQNYIYDRGLYTIGPVYKKEARYIRVDSKTEIVDQVNIRMVFTRGEAVICEIIFHNVNPSHLLTECGDLKTASRLRRYMGGKTAVLTGINGGEAFSRRGVKIALNEWLEYLQERGYAAAMYHEGSLDGELLSLFGFVPLEEAPGFWMVDTRSPVVLFHNTRVAIKESMVREERLAALLQECQEKLQKVLSEAYPGRLILCFDSEVVNYRLMCLVTESNRVSMQATPGVLGEKMCVPFGKILKGVRVPETVTWSLDTEKVYKRDLSSFAVSSFPGYAPLDIQIRTIRSFMRPVIFVDDLYHSGDRMRRIYEVLEKEGIHEAELIVGVVSGRGQDMADMNQQHVEAAYHIPNLFRWLIETDLYPFIGGDGVAQKDDEANPTMAIPSINAILPYEVPDFLKEMSMESLYRYSWVCMENARDIFRMLEDIYRKTCGRLLTMNRIGEVIAEPRYPETIQMDREKLRQLPSAMLEEEMEKLRRLMPAGMKAAVKRGAKG